MQNYATEGDVDRVLDSVIKDTGGWEKVKYKEGKFWYCYLHRGHLFLHKAMKGWQCFVSLTTGSLQACPGSSRKECSRIPDAIFLELEHMKRVLAVKITARDAVMSETSALEQALKAAEADSGRYGKGDTDAKPKKKAGSGKGDKSSTDSGKTSGK